MIKLTKLILLVLLTVYEPTQGVKQFKPKNVEDEAFWRKLGQDRVDRSLDADYMLNTGVARNVIFAIGDGMGLSTVTAARIYDGQTRGESGEENYLGFEHFPHTALLKTFSLSDQVTDSAGAAFSMASGIKSTSRMAGLSSNAKYNVCTSATGQQTPDYAGEELTTILDWSLSAGKSVGIVTTDSVVKSTPGAMYAHYPNRKWINDYVTVAPCRDIARQLIEDNYNISVILGGGTNNFVPRNRLDPNADEEDGRRDGRDLIEEWKKKKQANGAAYAFVETKDELEKVDAGKVDYLFGLFDMYRIPYIHERKASQPNLIQMVKKAINILSKNKNGFFLLIEGANIDKAHHKNLAQVAIREVVEFDKAVKAADELTDQSDTLMVVAGDHSHVFTISGYPKRGNPIFSFTYGNKIPYDGKPTTTLGYGNGPAWKGRNRPNITEKDLEDINFKYSGGRPTKSESHGGEDVAVYAKGPMAHLFHGVQDNTYVAHVMSYAACVGKTRRKCPPSAATAALGIWKLYIVFLVFVSVKII